jgi:hypothetical protein
MKLAIAAPTIACVLRIMFDQLHWPRLRVNRHCPRLLADLQTQRRDMVSSNRRPVEIAGWQGNVGFGPSQTVDYWWLGTRSGRFRSWDGDSRLPILAQWERAQSDVNRSTLSRTRTLHRRRQLGCSTAPTSTDHGPRPDTAGPKVSKKRLSVMNLTLVVATQV